MRSSFAIPLLSGAWTAVAASPTPRDFSQFAWGPCSVNDVTTPLPIQCSNLVVPLDYTSPNSTETLVLQLAKLPASGQPAKGSILFNFGGPGSPGRQGLADAGGILSILTGGVYDLIAFDTRGTQNTIPFSCYASEAERVLADTQGTGFSNASDVSLGTFWARAGLDADLCQKNGNGTGEFIGTAFVARDLMSVVDALKEDGMLRYWGLSYGTTLGATVAAMFPDRIDKMVLDAVQNPHEYYHASADFEEWTAADETFSGLFTACLKHPEACELANRNQTAQELEDATWHVLDEVKFRPIELGESILDYTALKGYLVSSLYNSGTWPTVASAVGYLLDGKLDELATLLKGQIMSGGSTTASAGALVPIHCGDRVVRSSSFEDFLPTVEKLYNVSRIYGDATVYLSMLCSRWKITAKEIYRGDFQVHTANPILFVGNRYDAQTALASAHNASSGFSGSRVLEIDGYGHSSISVPSTCTYARLTAYWINGTLPPVGSVCSAEGQPFTNVTWKSIFANVTA